MTPRTPRKETTAQRVARHRAAGVRVDVVLTDPLVLAAWLALRASCRSKVEAVALAVVMAANALPKDTGADNGPA